MDLRKCNYGISTEILLAVLIDCRFYFSATLSRKFDRQRNIETLHGELLIKMLERLSESDELRIIQMGRELARSNETLKMLHDWPVPFNGSRERIVEFFGDQMRVERLGEWVARVPCDDNHFATYLLDRLLTPKMQAELTWQVGR